MVTIDFGTLQKMNTTEIASPQEDSMSPMSFLTYLKTALRDVRSKLPKENKPIFEYLYAADLDFIFRSKENAEQCEEII